MIEDRLPSSDPDAWWQDDPLPAGTAAEHGAVHEPGQELEPVDVAAGLELALAALERLEGGDGLGAPDLPAGECDDCGALVAGRFELGMVALCRLCRRSRARVAARLGEQDRRPAPLPPPPMAPGQLGAHPHE